MVFNTDVLVSSMLTFFLHDLKCNLSPLEIFTVFSHKWHLLITELFISSPTICTFVVEVSLEFIF